jgi:GNAT superfamily N-acetyltransferase
VTLFKVTKAVVRFFAGEYDDDGNLLCELPVAAGKEEFEETVFFPFATAMLNTITQIERSLNEQSAPRAGASLQEGCPEQRVRGYECQTTECCEGGEEVGPQDPEGDAGGSPRQQPAEQERVEPEDHHESSEPEEGAACGQQAEEEIIIVNPGDDTCRQSNAAWLVHSSILHEGRPSNLGECDRFIQSVCDDPHALCLVAYCNQAMAGVVVAFYCPDATAEPSFEVRHLFVQPAHRKRKVAQALLRGLLDWARYDKDAPVFITTEGEPRPYYLALGFEPTHRVCVSSLSKLRERLRG